MASTLARTGGPDISISADRSAVHLLDAIDRARLTPLDALVLVHVAAAEATVVRLAEQLGRRPADVRRALTRLVARGLLRRRSGGTGSWGLTFGATAAGLDFVRSVGLESALAGGRASRGTSCSPGSHQMSSAPHGRRAAPGPWSVPWHRSLASSCGTAPRQRSSPAGSRSSPPAGRPGRPGR